MKREDKQMLLIYTLVFIIIVLLVWLTKIVLDANKPQPKIEPEPNVVTEEEVNPYPEVNDECTFSLSYDQYNQLTRAGCENGYTRYDINNVKLGENVVKVSIIYSDKNQGKVGLFVNDKKAISSVVVEKIKFGIFGNMLFIYDINNSNALVFNADGKEVYNLYEVLQKNKVKDLSTGDTYVTKETVDANSFKFFDNYFEFNSISNTCQNGESSSGSHYVVKFSGETFELPEFMNLIQCG